MLIAPQAEGLRSVGKYEIIHKIAEGGMGSVYKGRDSTTGDIVAIKLLLVDKGSSNDVVVRRFEQEFLVAHALNHPNLVRAIDFGREGNVPFLVMEFVDGESLGDRIARQGRLDEKESVRIATQIAHGLEALHERGMIHRDLKPDNILLDADGEAKLTDLGLVKDADTKMNLTMTGRGLGTPHFMAPEQFRNAKQADRRCDIYGLGATLYMAVTGELPFDGSSPIEACMKKLQNNLRPPRDVVPDLNPRLDWAIRRAMSADPQLRPATCAEFIDDISGRNAEGNPSEFGARNLDLEHPSTAGDGDSAEGIARTAFSLRPASDAREGSSLRADFGAGEPQLGSAGFPNGDSAHTTQPMNKPGRRPPTTAASVTIYKTATRSQASLQPVVADALLRGRDVGFERRLGFWVICFVLAGFAMGLLLLTR